MQILSTQVKFIDKGRCKRNTVHKNKSNDQSE